MPATAPTAPLEVGGLHSLLKSCRRSPRPLCDAVDPLAVQLRLKCDEMALKLEEAKKKLDELAPPAEM